jgi:hypothetical protein
VHFKVESLRADTPAMEASIANVEFQTVDQAREQITCLSLFFVLGVGGMVCIISTSSLQQRIPESRGEASALQSFKGRTKTTLFSGRTSEGLSGTLRSPCNNATTVNGCEGAHPRSRYVTNGLS